MGSLIGHVLPGVGFLLIGLWHLFNHIKLHALNPNSYIASPWFPTFKSKYSELYLIIAGSTASIAMELFISPEKHQPFDSDGTIPTVHLHTFEHSSISLALLVYASFAILLDKIFSQARHELIYFLGAIAFSQELLLFHLHSTDHFGPEGQYHFLLQLVVFVCLITTLMGIGFPKTFLISFVRSLSILFQGVWLIVMGFMLWTPNLLPKGCFLHDEDGRLVAKCSGEESLHRAKSLINLEFSWYLTGISIFGVSIYLVLVKIYGQKVKYFSLGRGEEEKEGEDLDDVESQKKSML
ncbi:hypothetical protein UlMin_033226 [Ulmus minor]